MATVELSISALPAHVRTARLVATAVARRIGLAGSTLDEVRLAVGEACSRAVEAHRAHCPGEPVRLELSDHAGRFEVVVADNAPGGQEALQRQVPTQVGESAFPELLAPDVGLAVIAGLADDVDFDATPSGMRIRMSWPAVPAAQPSGNPA